MVVIFAIGVLLGQKKCDKRNLEKSIGDLRVDTSDPDGPYLFLELATDPSNLTNMDYVVLKVNFENIVSQK